MHPEQGDQHGVDGANTVIDIEATHPTGAGLTPVDAVEFQRLPWLKQLKSWFVPLWAQWFWVILSLIILDLSDSWIAPRFSPPPESRDPSLSYVVGAETVSDDVMIVLSAVLPFVIVGIFSFIYDRQALGVNTLSALQSYSNGLLFMTVLKKVTGKPRPCFYSMCAWDWDAKVCTAEKKKVWKAYQSFPSGHALLSFAGLGFLAVFIMIAVPEKVFKRRLSPLELQVLQLVALLPMLLATWIGVSRMFDHLHDGADVAGGAGIGLACAGIGLWYMRANRAALMLGKGE